MQLLSSNRWQFHRLYHNVNGAPEEVGTLDATGCYIETGQEVVRARSHNTILSLKDCEVHAGNGVLIHTIVNDDPCATVPNDHPYGKRMNIRIVNGFTEVMLSFIEVYKELIDFEFCGAYNVVVQNCQ